MAIPIPIPRLGWNMEEGKFGGWLKRDGDPVRPGEPLFTLESEKATEEVEGLDAGFLRIPLDGPKPGDVLTVGTVIGYVVARADEELPSLKQEVPAAPASEPVASPAVRRLARERGIDLRQIVGSGPGGRISAGDLAPATRESERPEKAGSSPRARRAAKELGIDWTLLTGTGKNGRIRERDVRATVDRQPAGRVAPLTAMRRTIAARMLESQRTSAPVTLTTTVDATNLVNLRQQFRAAGDGASPSYTDFLIKLAAAALVKHPLLAGQWTDHGIRLPDAIHIGFAVDVDSGLLVPVVRDVPALGVRQIAATTRELIEWARGGRLSAADMQGGCFTISNLGAYGIDAFTPIINPPECAVLGVGRIARRPAVVGDAMIPRDQVTLSLTFDHRIVDGAPAARFLQTLAQAVENPAPWVIG